MKRTLLVPSLCLILLLPSCGPMSHTLFTLGGHNFTLGSMVISNTVKKVIENNQEEPFRW